MKQEKSKNILFSLTIVIPFYNSEKTISRTIESITNQSNCDWRIILVNDGSMDTSRLIAEEYRLKFIDRIKIIDIQNNGLSKARDNALNFVVTDYVMYLDSDDFLVEGVLRTFSSNEFKVKECDVIVTDYIVVSNGQSFYIDNNMFGLSDLKTSDIICSLERKIFFSLWTSNVIYKTSYIRLNNFKFSITDDANVSKILVNHMQGEEIMFAFLSLIGAKKIFYLPKPLAKYVQNSSSMSSSFDYSRLGAFYNVIFIVDSYRRNYNYSNFYKIIRNHFYKRALNGLIYNFFVLKKVYEKNFNTKITYSKLIKDSLSFYPELFKDYRNVALINLFSKNLFKPSSWLNLGFSFFPNTMLILLHFYLIKRI